MVQIADLAKGLYWKLLGMQLAGNSEGVIGVQLEVSEDLLQVYGNIHGGVIASLMDSAIAVAVNQELPAGEGAVTIEMKLNYLRPVKKGRITGEGKVIKKGRQIIVGQGEIRDEAGEVIALGTATFMRITA